MCTLSAKPDPRGRDGFRKRGALGHRSFGAHAGMTYLAVCLNSVKVCPSGVVSPQKAILCAADFGSTIALDLQQKLKTFLHSSQ